jgi:hypothetical protein
MSYVWNSMSHQEDFVCVCVCVYKSVGVFHSSSYIFFDFIYLRYGEERTIEVEEGSVILSHPRLEPFWLAIQKLYRHTHYTT